MDQEKKNQPQEDQNKGHPQTRIEVTFPAMTSGVMPFMPPPAINPYLAAQSAFTNFAPGVLPGAIPAPGVSPNIVVNVPSVEKREKQNAAEDSERQGKTNGGRGSEEIKS